MAPVSEQHPAADPALAGPRCVVVVDAPPDLERTCELARGLGYCVTGVEKALEALNLVRGGGVDLVVTELYMPGLDGWALAEFIEREKHDVHVVALTSSISEQGEALLTSRHIDGYLIKPIGRRQVEILLKALLVPGNLDRPAEAVIVDADAACLGRLEQTLGDVGVATAAFDDPRQAIAHAIENPPDLFITELDLGPFDGLDLCRDIRRSKGLAALPIFVLTDEATPDNVARAIRLHVDGFLVKPMTPDVLTRRVLRRLHRRKS